MMRFFRHGDGAFANFNGVASSAGGLVATLISYDEALGTPASSAAYSGYERVQGDGSVLLVDTGGPPPIDYSEQAHAGALSFEFSRGLHRIVINCGAPAARHEHLRRAARRTAAHSTATLNDESSCRFSGPAADARIVSGPRVAVKRHLSAEGATVLQMRHDGYSRRFGLVHERSLRLDREGRLLEGVDRFSGEPSTSDLVFAVRFHLHHAAAVHATDKRSALDIRLPDASVWRFEANGPVDLEESVHLSDVFGSRPTHQLVVAGGVDGANPVKWRLALLP
jgi:uncharacterized heparinase superfamily protein